MEALVTLDVSCHVSVLARRRHRMTPVSLASEICSHLLVLVIPAFFVVGSSGERAPERGTKYETSLCVAGCPVRYSC